MPAISQAAVLAAVLAGDDTLFKLAETFDVAHSSFTLRRVVYELADARQVRIQEHYGEPDRITVLRLSITPTTVLGAVQSGINSIWALAHLFEVPAVSLDLRAALGVLMGNGSVVASAENLYADGTTLKATSAGATDV